MPCELEEHWPDLVRFARSLTKNNDLADEIAQESMVRALQRGNELPAITNPRGWLFQIAANTFREWWRKKGNEISRIQELAERQPVRLQELPPNVAERREFLESIWKFIQALPPTQHQVLLLNLVHGLSNEQIADKLAMTTDQVKSNLCAARRKLRERFLKKHPDTES